MFSAATGYWVHKLSSLPVGADLFVDIHNRIGYGSIETIFDVGANVGQTWQWLRSKEKSAKIYAFEPVNASFEKLCEMVNGDANSVVEPFAFGEKNGEKTIRLFDSDSSLNSLDDALMCHNDTAATEVIKIDTIDNYCLRKHITRIDLLKIDTEGYELNVLKGAAAMLQFGNVAFIYCEVGFLKANNRNTYFAEITEWLAQREYHFNGLYHLVSNDVGIQFGNALYVHKSAVKL